MTTSLRAFLARFTWAGPLIGFVVGFLFGPGVVWQYADLQVKNRSTEIEQVKVEKDIYERLQLIQDEVLTAIPHYVQLRDQQVFDGEEAEVKNEYVIAKTKLASLIGEYNRLEAKLSIMESRQPLPEKHSEMPGRGTKGRNPGSPEHEMFEIG